MKIIEVDSHAEVINVIRQEVDSGVVAGRLLGLRHFPLSKKDTVLTTGTDRDRCSPIHFCDGDLYPSPEVAESAGVSQASYPVTPNKLTYMRVVDVDHDPPISVPHGRRVVPIFDSMDYLQNLSADMAQVLYDPSRFMRVSENEFWVDGDPRDAAIALVIVRQSK